MRLHRLTKTAPNPYKIYHTRHDHRIVDSKVVNHELEQPSILLTALELLTIWVIKSYVLFIPLLLVAISIFLIFFLLASRFPPSSSSLFTPRSLSDRACYEIILWQDNARFMRTFSNSSLNTSESQSHVNTSFTFSVIYCSACLAPALCANIQRQLNSLSSTSLFTDICFLVCPFICFVSKSSWPNHHHHHQPL